MRTQEQLLRDILDAVAAIRQYRDHGDLPPRVREVWLTFHLMVVGEAAGKLATEVREAMPGIPWPQIVRMRNHLIHGYFAIRLETVEETAAGGVEELAGAIERYLKNPPATTEIQ